MTIFAESGIDTRHQAATATERRARIRHYVMTPPRFFAVDYAINPWMDTTNPVDRGVALTQWQHLYDIYLQLGHTVDLVDPVPGLPDMVYAANGGLILDGTAAVARFKYAQRQQESARLRRMAESSWLPAAAYSPRERGPRRSAAGGRDDLGRVRFSNRPAGTRRDRRDLRPPGRSASNWLIRASTISIPR